LSNNHDIRTLLLIRSAKNGDNASFDSLLKSLEPKLKKIASSIYIAGLDKEDILQECRIAVSKAVNAFEEEGGASWENFAINVCVKRQLKTSLTQSFRFKYKHHNLAISLDAPLIITDDDMVQSLANTIQDDGISITDNMLAQDEYREISQRLCEKLTMLEEAVYSECAYDSTYKDIAERLGIQQKAVDNALTRIRKKAKEVYSQFLLEKEESENWP